MTVSVDTNVFLRFFVQDDPEKAAKVRKVFERAKEGTIELVTEPFIIIEVAYALSSYFKLPKSEICDKLRSILTFQFINIREREDIVAALNIYEERGVDFIDALLFVKTKKKEKMAILSFDKGFDKLTPQLRTEP